MTTRYFAVAAAVLGFTMLPCVCMVLMCVSTLLACVHGT